MVPARIGAVGVLPASPGLAADDERPIDVELLVEMQLRCGRWPPGDVDDGPTLAEAADAVVQGAVTPRGFDRDVHALPASGEFDLQRRIHRNRIKDGISAVGGGVGATEGDRIDGADCAGPANACDLHRTQPNRA